MWRRYQIRHVHRSRMCLVHRRSPGFYWRLLYESSGLFDCYDGTGRGSWQEPYMPAPLLFEKMAEKSD